MYIQFAGFSGPTWEDLGTELEIDRRNLKQSLLFLFFTLFYPFLFVPFRNLILLVLWEIFEALTGNPFQNSFMILKRAWHGFVCSTNCQCASFDWTQTGVPIDVECESFLLNKWTKKKVSFVRLPQTTLLPSLSCRHYLFTNRSNTRILIRFHYQTVSGTVGSVSELKTSSLLTGSLVCKRRINLFKTMSCWWLFGCF